MKSRWPIFLLVFLVTGRLTAGPAALKQLHSFGLTNLAAANPYCRLLQAGDGLLYGTTSAGGAFGQGTIFRISADGGQFQVLHSFGAGTNDGARPFAALVEGSDGFLYGTTEEGGQYGFGTLFQLSKDATTFSLLKSFSGGSDGAYPEAALFEASDHLLYGTASGGGSNDYGVVFRVAKDGSAFTTLVQFQGTNGANPEAELIEASDGLLYGTTSATDSLTNAGTVFRLQKNGTGFSMLKRFFFTSSIRTNGASPLGGLVEGTNGLLFGTTSAGGANSMGAVFQLNKDGTGYRTIYSFSSNKTLDGRIPLGELLLASDGVLYGTTYDGGTNGNGTVFRIGQDGGGYTELAALDAAKGPAGALVEATNGLLFCTSQFGGDANDGTVFSLQKDGSGLTIVKSFSASGGDGRTPYAAPTSVSSGLVFGTTRTGGDLGIGSVYSMRFDGEGYSQVSSLVPVGTNASPVGGLLQLSNGLLYGVTQLGGSSNLGAIFGLDPSADDVALVYSSAGPGSGIELRGDLIQASDGLLYGNTVSGGSSGEGTVFRVKPDGSEYTVLKSFAFGATGPGINPMEPLLEASDGNLYGTTYGGGVTNRGVLFSISKDGSTYTVLKNFGAPSADGESPMSPLIEDAEGTLYGTTYGGGSTNNRGTVFRINKDGTAFQVLTEFTAGAPDGSHPCGRLAQGSDGALYGTTERGGFNDQGALFKVNRDGSDYMMLASFGGSMGIYPRGGLVRGPDGALYGTTDRGGDLGFGTVFRYGPRFGDIVDVQVANQIPTVTGIGQPGTNYVLQRTLQLGPLASWTPVFATNAPAKGTFSVVDPTGGPQAFYRLKQ